MHELWVPGAGLAELLRWSEEASADFVATAPGAPDDRRASVVVSAFGARLYGSGGEERWLHAVALRAANEGVPSLTIDGASFTGDAPFYAFTERREGVERTLWFDPLRGLTAPEPVLGALLSRYLEHDIDFGDFLLSHPRERDAPQQTLVAREAGTLLRPPQLRPFDTWTPPPADLSPRLLSLVFGALPLGLTHLTLSLSPRPHTLEQALKPASLSTMLCFLLAFVPFVTPWGKVVPWPWRALWFVGSPWVFAWLDFRVRGAA